MSDLRGYSNITDFLPCRYPGDDFGVAEIIYRGLCGQPSRTIINFEAQPQTTEKISQHVGAFQNWLDRNSFKPGDKVALMIDNHPSHIALTYALVLKGIIWIPINKRLRSAGIQYIIDHCSPDLLIVQNAYYEIVRSACNEQGLQNVALKLEDLLFETEKNFEYTPSKRIRKHLLPQDTHDCWTLHG